MKPNDQHLDTLSDDPDVDTMVLVRLLISLMGEEVEDYADADHAPQELLRALRGVSTPILCGVLVDAVAELSRRKVAAVGRGRTK